MGLTENTTTGPLALDGLDVLPSSAAAAEDVEFGLAESGQRLAVLVPSGSQVLSGFEGESSAVGGRTLLLGPKNAANLGGLRGLGLHVLYVRSRGARRRRGRIRQRFGVACGIR